MARLRSAAALAGGLVALAAGAALWWLAPHDTAPYRYVVDPALSTERTQALGSIAERGITLEQGRVVLADSGETAADFIVAQADDGLVLLDWRAQVDEPFLTLLPSPDELVAVADAVRRHLPPNGVVLAWWDTSRALQLLAGLPVVFNRHLGEPLIVPPRWDAHRQTIAALDRKFFMNAGASAGSATATHGDPARFDRFVDALLSNEHSGIATLQEIAAGRPAVVVLHIRDALLLGALDPARLGVAFRDLPQQGPSHAAIRNVRDWMSANSFNTYTVMHREGRPLRAVALTDQASGERLAARLLPFIGNRQADVPGATLVYRTGAFVVYELDTRAADESAAVGSPPPTGAKTRLVRALPASSQLR